MNCKFSVIIPLYNKRDDIAATLASALAQSYPPHEIVVVDDGSTDGSGDVVRTFDSPLIRLISQPNAGECAARNRAMAEATGEYFALLDADDQWETGYLATIASLIEKYPDCGAYCTAFTIVGAGGEKPSRSPEKEGIVDDYFRRALECHILLPSETTLRREVVEQVGGFPVGMKLGGDQYMWVKLVAAGWRVACSPLRMMRYSAVAANRSSAIYVAEQTEHSFRDYYAEGDFWRNEYLARVELNKAIVVSAKGGASEARDTERFYRYTRRSRTAWYKLWTLNRLPRRWRAPLLGLYNRAAWILAGKGF
ncbi:MAG: glycosyltransferase family 2 protein [Rikenellaceae bacterium]|jgi:glycosyltransferase involved in cell wall biosynthesis|nr:glycosyltransferase family 2 protein [Rikenellaceae bacterium]